MNRPRINESTNRPRINSRTRTNHNTIRITSHHCYIWLTHRHTHLLIHVDRRLRNFIFGPDTLELPDFLEILQTFIGYHSKKHQRIKRINGSNGSTGSTNQRISMNGTDQRISMNGSTSVPTAKQNIIHGNNKCKQTSVISNMNKIIGSILLVSCYEQVKFGMLSLAITFGWGVWCCLVCNVLVGCLVFGVLVFGVLVFGVWCFGVWRLVFWCLAYDVWVLTGIMGTVCGNGCGSMWATHV